MQIETNTFTMTHCWEILPSLAIETHDCGNPACDATHGFSILLKWFAWGVEILVIF